LEGVSGPMKTSRMKGSVKVRNSQVIMAVKSVGVVARERMKGLLVGGVVAIVESIGFLVLVTCVG
jgi:hypothetical protein